MAEIDPLNNRAFLFGESLIETFLVLNGKPMLWTEHILRLAHGAKIFWGIDSDVYMAQLPQTFDQDGVYRLTLYQDLKNQFHIHLSHRSYESWPTHIKLQTAPSIFRNSSLPADLKVGNYFYHYWNLRSLKSEFFDLLFIDEDSNLLETTKANILFVKDQQIVSPKSSSRVLSGIGKKQIQKISNVFGYAWQERDIKMDELSGFSSVLLVNSVRGVGTVSQVDNNIFQPFSDLDLWNKTFYAQSHE